MAEAASKVPVRTERGMAPQEWRPFMDLRREMNRMFEDFDRGFWRMPFRSMFDLEPTGPRAGGLVSAPAVDVAEKDKAYEITAELPGMDEKSIEVKVANNTLTMKGEKSEEKEEKQKNYHLSERRYGSFERSFMLPEGVDQDKIEASFKQGVLKITLPKTADAQKTEKKIDIKGA